MLRQKVLALLQTQDVFKKRLKMFAAEQRIHADLDVLQRCQSRKTLKCPVMVVPYSASLGLKTKNRSGLSVSWTLRQVSKMPRALSSSIIVPQALNASEDGESARSTASYSYNASRRILLQRSRTWILCM